jgi:tetratricopeptide (TPR) repeat protein
VDESTATELLAEAEEAAAALSGGGAKQVLADLERQYADLLDAITWFLEHGRVDEARRMVTALGPFWRLTGLMEKSVPWFDKVLAPAVGSDEHLGPALYQAGYLAFWMGDDARSSSHYEHAIAVARRCSDSELAARGLVGLARIALRSNDLEGARRLCREALAETEGSLDPLAGSAAIHVLGVTAQMAGALEEAHGYMIRRIELGRRTGNIAILSVELGNISMVERQLGNLDRAEAAALEALEIDERRGDEWAVPHKLNALAAVAVDRGQNERAAILVGASEALVEAQAAPWPPDELAQYERTVGALASRMDANAMEFARATGRDMSRREAVEFGLGRVISEADTSL